MLCPIFDEHGYDTGYPTIEYNLEQRHGPSGTHGTHWER